VRRWVIASAALTMIAAPAAGRDRMSELFDPICD
jgi:hypothetical protein